VTTTVAPAGPRWSLARPPADYVLGHVTAVLPDRLVDDAWVVVRDRRIAEVGPHPAGAGADVDGGGRYCLPGLVDVHSDGLERERMPRPGAEVPWQFAIRSFEGKLRAAGVTTVFHGASFEQGASPVTPRTGAAALDRCAEVGARGDGPVDHRILHRLDVRCAEGLEALRNRLDGLAERAVVSHEDHMPGQGQYADRTYYERFLTGTKGLSAEQARAQVDAMITRRDGMLDVRGGVRVPGRAGARGVRAALRARPGVRRGDLGARGAGWGGGRVPDHGRGRPRRP
jgi:alpha-D-ribose 1-methylphosphonate 5-triphosphate diphosphatase